MLAKLDLKLLLFFRYYTNCNLMAMIEFQRELELTSLDENTFMNMCIVVWCDYVNILDQGSVFVFCPCFVAVVSI